MKMKRNKQKVIRFNTKTMKKAIAILILLMGNLLVLTEISAQPAIMDGHTII